MPEPSFAFIFAWLALVIGGSIVSRVIRGKPIWYPPTGGRFVQRMVSGFSHKACRGVDVTYLRGDGSQGRLSLRISDIEGFKSALGA